MPTVGINLKLNQSDLVSFSCSSVTEVPLAVGAADKDQVISSTYDNNDAEREGKLRSAADYSSLVI